MVLICCLAGSPITPMVLSVTLDNSFGDLMAILRNITAENAFTVSVAPDVACSAKNTSNSSTFCLSDHSWSSDFSAFIRRAVSVDNRFSSRCNNTALTSSGNTLMS